MAGNEEARHQKITETQSSDVPLSSELNELLEAVLNETRGRENSESLEWLISVARKSKYDEINSIDPVKEVVKAILSRQFGERRLTPRLLQHVAAALYESPEAMSKLSNLWKKAKGNEQSQQ
ncbi:MAG: hypothetical protein KF752_08855 [Pirellulaceae bacterium]|nr:hypothetical protein [Pirellulaceae bacterium]